MMPTNLPPHSREAEQAILGGLLIDNSKVPIVLDLLSVDDFYFDPHRIVFLSMEALATKNQPLDWITVSESLKQARKFDAIGGPAFLAGLADAIPTASNILHYVEVVKEKSQLRQIISAARAVLDSCYTTQASANEARETFQRLALETCGTTILHTGLESLGNILPRTLCAIDDGENRGISSGLLNLDHFISGFRAGDLYVVGARTSMGKSAFAKDVSMSACRQTGVAIFSLEMSKNQLVERYLAKGCKLNLHKLRCGHLTEWEWAKIQDVSGEMADYPILIDDTPAISISQIRFRLREAVLRFKIEIGMVVVDFLQLQKTEKSYGSENDRISAIANGLKSLAKEFKTSVVALSQLNREVERRDVKNHGRRPKKSDLRGSGGIEEAADVIILLYRPEVYMPDNDAMKGVAEAIVDKHRNGPCGTARLVWDESTATFRDAVPDGVTPPPMEAI